MTEPDWPHLIAAVVVGILSAARLTRLVTSDDFPPTVWLRVAYANLTRHGVWSSLLQCLWCFGPWMTLVIGTWAVLSDLHWTWWAFNGWLAASYVVSMIVFHDEGHSEDAN